MVHALVGFCGTHHEAIPCGRIIQTYLWSRGGPDRTTHEPDESTTWMGMFREWAESTNTPNSLDNL